MEHIWKFPSACCNITLNSMCKCIHTCCCSKSFWHWWHHIRVKNCYYRNIFRVNTNHFSVLLSICNYIVDCSFGCSTCCSRNRNNRNTLICSRSNAFKRTNICKIRIFYNNSDCFGSIHWWTATDSNNAVCTGSFKSSYTCLNIFNSWIWLDFAVDFIVNISIIKYICDLLCNTEFNKIRVGTNKSLFKTSSFYFGSYFFNSTRTVITCFI